MIRDVMLRRIVILTSVVGLLWVLYLLLPVLLPFFAALLIAYLFSPLVAKIQANGIPRWLAISLVALLISSALVLSGWYLIPIIWQQMLYLYEQVPTMIHWVNKDFLPWVSTTFNLEEMILDPDAATNAAVEYIQTHYSVDNLQNVLLGLAYSGLNLIQVATLVILVPVLSFYFLLDWEKMLGNLRTALPRSMEKQVLEISLECHSVLGAFVKGQFMVMFLLGVIYAVGLQLIGLKVGIIIGLVAGLASIIPYLGFVVGIVAALVATFFQFGTDWVHFALLGVVFLIGQMVESYILQPFLLGDKIGLSPVAVIFAILAGAQLMGFVGMLIALPAAAVLVVLLRHAYQAYLRSSVYGVEIALTTQDIDTALEHVEEQLVVQEVIADAENEHKEGL